MSIKFVLSSDNKYVQYRCKTRNFSPYAHDWYSSVSYNFATNLVGITLSLENKPSQNIISVTLSRPYGYGLIYYQTGWYNVSNAITTDLITVNGLNIIYFNDTLQEILLTKDISNITADCVILEALYMQNGEANTFCWTTPQVAKTNFGYETNTAPCFASKKMIEDIANANTSFRQYLHLTNIYGVSITLTNNNDSTVTIKIEGDGYIFHEKGFVGVGSLTKTLSLTNGNNLNVIYYSPLTSSVEIARDVNTLAGDDIIFEIFYSMNGGPNNGCWTTSYVTKVGFLDMYDKVLSYQNVYETKQIASKVAKLEKQTNAPFPYSINIFRRIACIGDSYTEGFIQPTGEGVTINKNYSWPHYLSILTGNHIDNYGVSGSTTKSWISGTPPCIEQIQGVGKKAQAYIVGLGLNDRNNPDVSISCGTPTDIGTDADTYYAWYYKVIQAIVNVNNEAMIFCTTCPSFPISDDFNVAVRTIVSYCKNHGQNVYLVDLASNSYMTEEYFLNPVFIGDGVNYHYTAIGYEYMAECLHKILSDVINDNITDFQNVVNIPFDTPS
jgi:lysophospholipase L1-like esterase